VENFVFFHLSKIFNDFLNVSMTFEFLSIFHDFPGKFIFPGFLMIFHDRGNPDRHNGSAVFLQRCCRHGN